MKSYLKKEAIEEITQLLNEVKIIEKLVNNMGITLQSDSWTAVFPIDHHYSNILSWDKKDFETLDISGIDGFNIGGCITTYSHQYKDSWIVEPKKLVEEKSKTVQNFLESIINSLNLNYFNLELDVPYKICNNDGWEHFVCIKTKIKNNAIESRLNCNEKHIISKEIKETLSKHNLKGDISINNKQIHINIK